ncbi:MAG: response regulator [Pirellulales bacterium]
MSEAIAGTISTSRVLVVDPQEETRAVLETMLSRRGIRIVTTARRDEGLRLARDFQPDVIVLDCETPSVEASDGTTDAERPFASASPDHPPSLVLIGSTRRAANATADAGSSRYLQKPYDYGPLIHTIEELLASRRAA